MAYTEINFKTGKAFKEAFKSGKKIAVFQPGPFGPAVSALAAPVRPDIRLIRFGQQSVAIEGKR